MNEIIELGGGSNPQYHPNFDAVEGDTICDCTKGIPLLDASVEGIYSKDFLEHLTFAEGLQLLKECWRVLKNDGFIEFIIPDVEAAIQADTEWNDHTRNIIFGTRRHKYDVHKCWYSPDLMAFILDETGWKSVAIELLPSEEPKFNIKGIKL